MKKRYLTLADGSVYEGYAFGADKTSLGELVFTTGMCGYTETLTDPSYYGQIVLHTFPLIGNYGVNESDAEGNCFLKGYIVHEYCEKPSNFRAELTLDEFLKKNNVPAIYGLDTRAITRKLREEGVLNAAISDEPIADLSQIKGYKIIDAVKSVTLDNVSELKAEKPKKHIVLMDFGAKRNIARELNKRGNRVTVVPSSYTAEQILALKPDGVMLSNGPGDPKENVEIIAEIKKLLGKTAIFGICLGHQLLALAAGGDTFKLKYGHRGVNQPVKALKENRTFITSQNHGYAVIKGSVKGGEENYLNANDLTIEGIDYPKYRAFSVQFHPEACSGPKDTEFLFDKFMSLMEKN